MRLLLDTCGQTEPMDDPSVFGRAIISSLLRILPGRKEAREGKAEAGWLVPPPHDRLSYHSATLPGRARTYRLSAQGFRARMKHCWDFTQEEEA